MLTFNLPEESGALNFQGIAKCFDLGLKLKSRFYRMAYKCPELGQSRFLRSDDGMLGFVKTKSANAASAQSSLNALCGGLPTALYFVAIGCDLGRTLSRHSLGN
ncbi:Hypothetical predicted protein [Olea europaea subsp. europaea]|uniref:Uncharacterized protein n=1 Tax=Olea europaea subsp. europaea TaxID=158383 RepID=A0A8S0QFB2_OLEEU|nr:Hypothetical predicted protein [Olea europaea subsp. europaea]